MDSEEKRGGIEGVAITERYGVLFAVRVKGFNELANIGFDFRLQ
jgi:hypothetical protein